MTIENKTILTSVVGTVDAGFRRAASAPVGNTTLIQDADFAASHALELLGDLMPRVLKPATDIPDEMMVLASKIVT